MPELDWLLGAFPNFARYVVTSFALTLLFTWIYTLITPWREFALIRAGNSAAAIALIGALLGFCLPLANTIAHSASLLDLVLWAGVALVVQVIVHIGMRLMLPHLPDAIEADTAAAGITAGGFALSFGLINAACLTT
jgi:putative membrane protein